ncbi:P-loop NTPase fold protein [uncultured Bacteroides sp.]|uniref:P-loop NTPase fold protein n=1 Tax=uncultured Bacteroides sp. TaxID=162156 RepID=UPI0025B2B10F|nr:P-loop NTPase fold protein [uncultured Bacteroides sp.]
MKRRALHHIGIICILFICICLLFPITESLSKRLGEHFFTDVFGIPYQLRIAIDIAITVISALVILWFTTIKHHRIDISFLNGLLIFDIGLMIWWGYERFFNDSIYFYPIYDSYFAYFDILIVLLIVLTFISFYKYHKKVDINDSKPESKHLIQDAPKTDISEDSLEREPLAENLVKEILSLDTENGSRSLAITSAWGNGKTTFLNFVKEKLLGKIEIISIAPWSLAPGKSITTFFFQEIIKKFGGINYTIAKSIKEYAFVLEAIEIGWLEKSIKTSDLAYLTKSISDKLKECRIKLLIIIDDIDRLSAPEIEEVFRIIRGSANFSNFIFLRAFDRRYVQSALRNSNPAYNENYIEKFFESEFSLPELRAEKLHKIILDNLDWLDEADRKDFVSYVSLEKFISSDLPVFYPFTNLRSIYRWLNGIHGRYRILKGECKIEDLADLEMLYLLFPEVYTLLSKDFMRVLYTERYTNNYQLWDSGKVVSKDDDFLLYLHQKNYYDIREYCKIQFKYDDYKMKDLVTILDRLLPSNGRVNDLSKGFSNPNYTRRYFNGILESSEISDKQFDEIITTGKVEIKKFIDDDIDCQYSHALFLQSLNKSRSTTKIDDAIIENIIYLVLYGTMHYGHIMLSSYDLAHLINKLSYDSQSKKTYVRNIITEEPFSFNILVQFSPIHIDGTNDLTSVFSKEESDSIMAEMLTKAIKEKHSFNKIADYFFYSKTKEYTTDEETGKRIKTYKSLNSEVISIYKRYLAENFLAQTSHYVWHDHPNEELVFPSEYFTEFWPTWKDFILYCEEIGIHNTLSETDENIINEYQSFMQKWIDSDRKPIEFGFSFIKF